MKKQESKQPTIDEAAQSLGVRPRYEIGGVAFKHSILVSGPDNKVYDIVALLGALCAKIEDIEADSHRHKIYKA